MTFDNVGHGHRSSFPRCQLLFIKEFTRMSQPVVDAVLSSTANSDRDEGVLSDVLDELDRERLRRAELEAEIRKLHHDNEALRKSQQQQRPEDTTSANDSAGIVSQRVFVAMETQVKGFQELVDALTLGKPAIAAAAAEEEAILAKKKMMTIPMHRFGVTEQQRDAAGPLKRKTLPLHVVRLLEVLPWDPKSRQHVFAVEEVFEWQTYQESIWQSQLQHFPPFFKTLPLIKAEATKVPADDRGDDQNYEGNRATDDKKENRNFLQFLAGADLQRKQNKYRMFTDGRVSVIYDLDAGYPLPSNDGGVWEWVGSWRISSRTTTGSITGSLDPHEKVDSDLNGWSYVMEPRDFLIGLKDMIWDNAGSTSTNDKPTRLFRRRRWTRQRVLVDYQSASESTKQYLKLLSENARLSLSASKISEQLIETKLMLTETEEKLAHANDLLHMKRIGVSPTTENQSAGSPVPSPATDEVTPKPTVSQLESQFTE